MCASVALRFFGRGLFDLSGREMVSKLDWSKNGEKTQSLIDMKLLMIDEARAKLCTRAGGSA